uniref:Uncharacterized protein n=1 Tax=Aegilops tauschii TaxID=37682 RepID=M8BRA4_AEGTA
MQQDLTGMSKFSALPNPGGGVRGNAVNGGGDLCGSRTPEETAVLRWGRQRPEPGSNGNRSRKRGASCSAVYLPAAAL